MIDLALNNRILLENDLELALQEIDMVLNTANTELIGYPEYGVNLESFLWTLSPTTTELNKYISDKLNDYCVIAQKFKISVNTQYYQGNYRSIYVVSISLTDEAGITYTRKYQYK